MRVFIQFLAVFSAFCLLAVPAMAEENSGFGVSLFDNRPPPALEDIPADDSATLNAITPAAGPEVLPPDTADSASAGKNADFIGDNATADPVAKKTNPDIVWP